MAESKPIANSKVGTSSWSPLRLGLFRALWLASLVSNIGTWMQNVGAAWLMTSLTPSPLLVALLQTATSLPVFLVGLPAGAIADIVDRRKMLLITQALMLLATAGLGVLTLANLTTPWLLLTLTFALGLGAAMNSPVWQAIVPELVPRAELHSAIALNSVAFNLARAVGPAFGGLIVAAAGPGAVFLLNAASFVAVIFVVFRWEREPQQSPLPPERLTSAMRAGVRYVRYSSVLRAMLVRTAVFIFCASALWALLPLIARQDLKLDAGGYGLLLGCLGLGAVGGAMVLPRLRQRYSADQQVAGATVVFALTTLVLGYLHYLSVLCPALIAGGMGWITVTSNLNVTAQTSTPRWVQARALALYLLVFQGGLALGGIIWGLAAEGLGDNLALLIAAIGLGLGLFTMLRWQLQAGQNLDLRPSQHWPEPQLALEPELEEGPVLVTVEYRIDPGQANEFASAMRSLSRSRRRSGAYRWNLFHDPANPGRYLEIFLVASWAEHLRQHARVTMIDRAAEERTHAFHLGPEPPQVTHLLTQPLPPT